MKLRIATCSCLFLLLGLLPKGVAGQVDHGVDLRGVVDVHVHSAPVTAVSPFTRSVNSLEIARIAQRHGMRALLLKNHYLETASQAHLISQVVTDIRLFGGIALNRSYGGINPDAVRRIAGMPGDVGQVVFLPTFDSEHYNPDSPEAVPIMEDGELVSELLEIFEIMGEHDLALSTGHSSPEGSLMAIRAARTAGVDRVMVQHPSLERVGMSLEMQKEAAQLGAYLEYAVASQAWRGNFDEFASQIREVGPENVILSSDLGQLGNPVHTAAFKDAIPRLLEAGFTETEIELMTRRNPARFLGLDGQTSG